MNIPSEVLAVLQQATIKGNNLIMNGQLDRKLYVKTNEVLEAIGGKWSRKDKAHVFASDPRKVIQSVVDDEEVVTSKDRGFFPTPFSVVELMIDLADLEAGQTVLEPSAGDGAIAKPVKDITGHCDCVELHDESRQALAKEGFNVVGSDFLQLKPTQSYDRVVMNPPFSKGIEVDHVTHALRFLKPDGLLVSVLPTGIKYRTQKKWVTLRDRIDVLEDLPEGTFKEADTMVNTCLIRVRV